MLGVILVVSATVARTQQPRYIADTDLLKFVWTADRHVSPGGTQVAVVRGVVNENTDAYDTNLIIVPADGRDAPRELTMGTRDSSPRGAPDGKRLAFVRASGRR